MKISQSFFALGCLIAALGCGSSGDEGNKAKEFSQSVDRVPYALSRVEINATLGTAGKEDAERLQKIIGEVGRSRENIQRLIKGPSFVLVINDKESSVQISSAGKIEHRQTVAENGPGCELSGVSTVSGLASSLNYELDWELTAELKGPSCDESMLTKYYKFQGDELDVFHLNSVKALLESSDIPRDTQRRIHLQLRLEGDSH